MKAPDSQTTRARVALGPYQGLTFFTEHDAPFFFGRDHWRDVIIANLRARRLTVLYGPSGVGKSSLLRAGVNTRLDELAHRRGALQFVPVYFSTWQTDPAAGLAAAVRERTKTFAGRDVRESGGLVGAIEAATAGTGVPLLIVLDQFEDYWTYQAPRARAPLVSDNGGDVDASFAADLATVLDGELVVHFLISLREDSLAQLDRTFKRRVSRLLDHRLSLTPLSREEGELAIRGPLTSYSDLIEASPPLEVEDSLVDVVLDQVRVGRVSAGKGSTAVRRDNGDEADAIEAPYLQLVMRRLWESAREEGSHVLRAATLARFGGAEEIVTTHVASSLADVDPSEQDAIAELLRYLVSPSHTKLAWTVADLSRFTRREEEEVRGLLAILADPARRIVRPVGNGGVPRYEIFHDVLAEPLLDWASAREITRAETERARRLDAEQREAQERRAKVRAQWVARGLVLGVFAALVVLAVVFLMNARHQHETAQSEQLAALAVENADLGQASLLALESYAISHTEDAKSAILQVAGSHELGMPFAAPDGGINQVAWSADGTRVATAGGNGWVRLWDAKTHRELARIQPPGLLAALGSTPHYGVDGLNIGAIAFSPDGRLLAYGQNVEYYSPPDGNRAVQGTVQVWDVQARKPLFVLGRPTSRINALAFSPDGRRLAVADGELGTSNSDNTIRLWTMGARRTVKKLRGRGPVNSVAFSPDGRTLASSSCDYGNSNNHEDTGDHSVSLWNTRSGRRIGRLRQSASICAVAFSPSGATLAAAGDDHAVTLWDVRRLHTLEPGFVGHTDVLDAVSFSPDGRTLTTAGRDHTVRLWDVRTHRQLGPPLTVVGTVNSVAFSPSGMTIAAGGADGASIWSLVGPYERRVLYSIHDSPVYSVAFSPDGRLLAWTDSYAHKSKRRATVVGTIYIWDVRADRMLDEIAAPTDNVNSLAFGPGGRTLAWAATDRSVWLWNVWKHALVTRIAAPPPTNGSTAIERVAISADGDTIAFAEIDVKKATIGLWSVQGRHLTLFPLGKVGGIGGLAFSRHTHLLASAGFDGKVRLFDLTRDRQLTPLVGRTSAGSTTSQYDVAFSPDGRTLASAGGDGAIMFWDVASHRELGAPLTEHTAAAFSVAFSGDGKTLASASLDGTVRLWDVSTRRALLTLAGHTSYVFGVAFSRDLGIVASAGNDGTVRLWGNISLQSAIQRLCPYINPRTGQRTWQRTEPSVAYRPICR